MLHSFRVLLLAAACSASLAAYAQSGAAGRIDIPAGDLVGALDTLAKRSGVQFVYRADQLKGLRTPGVQGAASADDALDRLLRGSGYIARRDASGAVVIVKSDAPATRPAPRPAASGGASADADAVPQNPVTQLETVQVTGSRIPRAQREGPAPVTVITSSEISASGFATVPEVLRSMAQNNGETQSQQSSSAGDFSPGGEQVDLRGLGPNHTLVLVNGRRIADFPMPFKGRSNFTDISNIPLGMVDRIEVLTGSASAVYGSDAISGVVNFILKKYADGTTLDYRYGDTERGGGESHKLSLSSGFSRGDFNAVFGVELIDQKPLWAYERGIQDSTEDSPAPGSRTPRRVFLRTDWNDDYIDPGQATCDALSYLNDDSTFYAFRNRYGNFCGSQRSIGYGTILSKRQGANAYGSLTYAINDDVEWFADLQAGYHKVNLFTDVRSWNYQAADGNEEGYFYNQNSGQVEYWSRQFTPEEMGGLEKGDIRNKQKTFSLTTGFKGTLAQDWDWEVALSHSQYESEISWAQIVASRANDLFLGPQLGEHTDDDGLVFPIFDADPNRLYTPLTRGEYDRIAARSVYHPRSRTDTLSFTLTNADLFDMPAGPAGFAAIAEYGDQSYDLNPDPLATQYYYYSWKDSDGKGDRTRWATAGELRLPLHETLNASVAGRYDQYRFAGNHIGKFTYSAGLEWRPLQSLLVRGSYGTGFRAPDLHYVFAGIGNDESSGVDYYRCRTEEPDSDIPDCSYSDEGLIRTRAGNRELEPETSKSWTAGFVWSPSENFDLSIDWFDIKMDDQVQDLRADEVLQTEADCRIGQRVDGSAIDPNSPSCVDAIGRVTRLGDGRLYGIYVNPINIANESTNGIDASLHYTLPTRIGEFRFTGNYTWTREHDIQLYAGDEVIDEFAVNSGFDVPRTKASASVNWTKNAWSATLYGQRLGRLPNSDSYDGLVEDGDEAWIGATYRYNGSLQYRFTDHMQLSLSVTNLFDKLPPKDPTYTAYPYYDISWFDSIGRSYYLQFTYKFGGKAL